MSKFIKAVLIITNIYIAIAYPKSNAAVVVDKGQTETFFKVDGQNVTPEVANASAQRGANVIQCKPVKNKNYVTKDGAEIKSVYNCKEVDLVISAKTGASHWKNK